MAGSTGRYRRVLRRATKTAVLLLACVSARAFPSLSWAASGTLRVCDDVEEPASLDPYSVFSEKVHTVLQQMLEGLVRFDADGHLEPALAVSWERMDKLRMRFHLRPDVRFHDGEPFDAASVRFSLERYVDPKTGYPGFGFVQTIERVDIVDDHTVDVVTHEPDGLLLNRLAAWVHIVPQGYYQKVGPEGFSQHPIGTGPFMFVRWDKGKDILMAANKNYWRPGLPRMDKLEFEFLASTEQVAALEDGTVDILTNLPGTQTLEISQNKYTKLIKKPTFYTIGSSLMNESGPLADRRVRQAMNYALNKTDLIRYDVLGNGIALGSLTFPGQFGHNARLEPYPFDLLKARQLLKEAGYPNGFRLKTFLKINAERTGKIIAAQLEQVGIHLDLTLVPDAQLIEYFQKQRWDMTIGDVPDPMNSTFFIQAILIYSKSPFSLTKDPVFDKKLEEMMSTLDPQRQQSLSEDLDRYVHDQALSLFTYQRIRTYGVRRDIDFDPSVTGMPYFVEVGRQEPEEAKTSWLEKRG